MKRTIVITFVGLLVLGSAHRAQAQVREDTPEQQRGSVVEHCSLNTLKGSYGNLFKGNVLDFPQPGENPAVIVARDVYDGAGHVTEVGSSMISGTPIAQHAESAGTYTVNGDCTGSYTMNFPGGFVATAEFVIVNHGKEVFGILTTGGFTVSFDSKKQ